MMTTEEYNDKPTGSNDGRCPKMTKLIPLDAAIEAIEKWWNNPQSTAQSPMTLLRAIPTIDPAAIREAALKEALDMALAANRGLVRLNEMTEARAQRFEAALEEIASHDTGATAGLAHTAMIALIGEKK